MIKLILLTYSLHTGGHDFNENNYGIGFEYTDNLTYGIYRYQNSYNKPSNMISISKQWSHIGLGLAIANGYEDDINSFQGKYLASPEITIKLHENIRIKTSFPFGTMVGTYDVVNLQFTFTIKE